MHILDRLVCCASALRSLYWNTLYLALAKNKNKYATHTVMSRQPLPVWNNLLLPVFACYFCKYEIKKRVHNGYNNSFHTVLPNFITVWSFLSQRTAHFFFVFWGHGHQFYHSKIHRERGDISQRRCFNPVLPRRMVWDFRCLGAICERHIWAPHWHKWTFIQVWFFFFIWVKIV